MMTIHFLISGTEKIKAVQDDPHDLFKNSGN